MMHHPHVHMIVPGGGLFADGTEWIECRRNFFLSVRVLSRLYRRRILEGLLKLHKTGQLEHMMIHKRRVAVEMDCAFGDIDYRLCCAKDGLGIHLANPAW